MNILLTSSGRRTTLLKAFKAAANRRGAKAFAGDADSLAPTLFLADRGFELPLLSDAEYIPYLLNLVVKHEIKLVVPTIDTELMILAENADLFTEVGCKIVVSSTDFIGTCLDKWKCIQSFGKAGVLIPRTWLPEQIDTHSDQNDLPRSLFVKPRKGSAGQNAYSIDRHKFRTILPIVPDAIIQEAIEAQEVTIDVLLDFDGRPIHFVPRERIRTLAGESIQGLTFADPAFSNWILSVLKIATGFGAAGPLTLQAFLTKPDPTFSEINPRFGGGFPLALAAGGDYPEWIMQIIEGHDMTPRLGEYTNNLYMTRYYEEIFQQKRVPVDPGNRIRS